ncbi:MAG: Zinc metalloprotease [uncultured Paraburkholderia sp.]|nr:MAG: Zinc metalloprotease [uncultured Paraburkholderia sp.]CAH2919171.1 MAG: Zinc metalloprotease [uncultured Paraburkholderia sp.]
MHPTQQTAQPDDRLAQAPLRAETLRAPLDRLAIDSTGLTITAPRWVTLADIETAITEK